ncbi:cytochrome b/b6 domain-containing protein [Pseudomonadota bacterium]
MKDSQDIKVWDPMVRIFHWGLAAIFVIAYATEDELMTVHAYAGYVIIGLLAFRLIWGFIGTRHARFSDFVRPPHEAIAYVKDMVALRAKRFLGHNPAGGLMIMALLLSLLLTTLTGLVAYGVEGGGPLAGGLSGAGEFAKEAFEEIHEFFANFTLFLVVVHVAGVILGSILHSENLIRAMFTGKKPA